MLSGSVEDGNPLTAAERAREPRPMLTAWFDGWAAGLGGGRRFDFPRRLTAHEAELWREGFDKGRRA